MYTLDEMKNWLNSHPPASLNYLGVEWLDTAAIKQLELNEHKLQLKLQLGYPVTDLQNKLIQELSANVLAMDPKTQLQLDLDWKVSAHAVSGGTSAVKGVKNIIAVASGKGGVGKSTTTVNLALALKAQGAQVGILDADIYGPNQPQMLGAGLERLEQTSPLKPIVLHGIQSMSIGYLVDTNTPMIWRGPMVSSALQQLLFQTEWQDLDYLLIDLPPGTGDIQLTLSQKVPLSGAIIVTTPQDIALLDARKGLEMFRKLKVPLLGLVENMSLHTCSACGHQESIFGSGGGAKMAEDCQIDLLGQLPLDREIREDADRGYPTVIAKPASQAAANYHEVARKMAAKLARQALNYAVKFPKIIVE